MRAKARNLCVEKAIEIKNETVNEIVDREIAKSEQDPEYESYYTLKDLNRVKDCLDQIEHHKSYSQPEIQRPTSPRIRSRVYQQTSNRPSLNLSLPQYTTPLTVRSGNLSPVESVSSRTRSPPTPTFFNRPEERSPNSLENLRQFQRDYLTGIDPHSSDEETTYQPSWNQEEGQQEQQEEQEEEQDNQNNNPLFQYYNPNIRNNNNTQEPEEDNLPSGSSSEHTNNNSEESEEEMAFVVKPPKPTSPRIRSRVYQQTSNRPSLNLSLPQYTTPLTVRSGNLSPVESVSSRTRSPPTPTFFNRPEERSPNSLENLRQFQRDYLTGIDPHSSDEETTYQPSWNQEEGQQEQQEEQEEEQDNQNNNPLFQYYNPNIRNNNNTQEPEEDNLPSGSSSEHTNNNSEESEEEMAFVVKPPKFSGVHNEDPKEWLEDFVMACQANNWNEERTKNAFGAYLRKGAREWYLEWSGANDGADWPATRVLVSIYKLFNGRDIGTWDIGTVEKARDMQI
ncbi:hypothetical protein Glove_155g159 [Diversispora epigaea]|uniref:Retrotransposon gag domain-containing protein n=1 Tax=Diversispora epigaea TaxID=1348612 RepID=A0A397IS31_9GLOM|nr:hypothetical protein Glove_155g159 [Diversispora epigaea]